MPCSNRQKKRAKIDKRQDYSFILLRWPLLVRLLSSPVRTRLRPGKVIYFFVHYGGIRALCVYSAAGQHKRMVYSVFAQSLLVSCRDCDLTSQRERRKRSPQKTLTRGQDI